MWNKGEQIGSSSSLTRNNITSPKIKLSRGGLNQSRSQHLANQTSMVNQYSNGASTLNGGQSPVSKSVSLAFNPLQQHRQSQEINQNGFQKNLGFNPYFQDQQQQVAESTYLYNGYSRPLQKKSSSSQVSTSQSNQSQMNQIQNHQSQSQHQASFSKGEVNLSAIQLPKLPSSHQLQEGGKQNNSSTIQNENQNTPNSQNNNSSTTGSHNQQQGLSISKSQSFNSNVLIHPHSTTNAQNHSSSSKNTLKNIAKFSQGSEIPHQSSFTLNNAYALSGAVSPSQSNHQENGFSFQQSRQSMNSRSLAQSYLGITSPQRPPSNLGKDSVSFLQLQKNSFASPTSAVKSSTPKSAIFQNLQKTVAQSYNPPKSSNSSSNMIAGVLSPSNKGAFVKTLNLEITPQKPFTSKNSQIGASTPNNQSNNNPPLIQDLLDPKMIPKIDKSKISTKQIGIIQAYGANTHQGLVRGYNEDRVSIILNMVKPHEKQSIIDWPSISYFAIYDGHGGANCADYLRDQLHFYIVKDEEFPRNPEKAMHNGFVAAEEAFLKMADSQTPLDKSGSCAVVVMLINDNAYIANLGDSRAVLSCKGGKKVVGLTVDHKPNFPEEEKRILANGGKVYQSQVATMQPRQFPQFIKGPHRVMPGRLAVSRTMGDAEAKLKKYGGNSKVVLCEPDVTQFKITPDCDFVMLGCDGIFDKLSNEESIEYLWENLRDQFSKKETRQSLHEYVGDSIEYLLRQTFLRKSFDNLTVVIISLSNLEKLFS